jgi:hypothetical protein
LLLRPDVVLETACRHGWASPQWPRYRVATVIARQYQSRNTQSRNTQSRNTQSRNTQSHNTQSRNGKTPRHRQIGMPTWNFSKHFQLVSRLRRFRQACFTR